MRRAATSTDIPESSFVHQRALASQTQWGGLGGGGALNMTPMQRLLRLPVNAVGMVKATQGEEEARSPVLTADGPQQACYSSVRPKEAGEQEEQCSPEERSSSAQAQPLR